LRHRRRLSTQTIRRKNYPASFQPIEKKSKSFLGRFFTIITILIIVVALGYTFMEKIWPILPLSQHSDQAAGESMTNEYASTPLPVNDHVERETYPPVQKRIQVEVLNGCGESGIAKRIADRLKLLNYDVVNSGNYLEKGKENFNVPNTRIIDQIKSRDNYEQAKELAGVMGVDTKHIESFENPSPIADLTIVIGKDFEQLSIFKAE
jgi:hypothetical protein